MSYSSSEIAIVGITYLPKWYKGKLKSIKHTDKVRGDLTLYAVRYAASVGYKVVVVDGKSSKSFQEELRKIKGIKLSRTKDPKRSPNRRKALFEASQIDGVRAIVMTELEKVSVITDCIDKSVRPIFESQADVVIPKREDALFKKTYPDYMYVSESEGNLLYNEALRANGLLSTHDEELDLFFGVRVFKNDPEFLKKIISKYDANPFSSLITSELFDLEEYSNSQFFPVVKALKYKAKVMSVTVPFIYPEKQKENETLGERETFMSKRQYQKLTILIELMHFLGYLNHKQSRTIRKIK